MGKYQLKVAKKETIRVTSLIGIAEDEGWFRNARDSLNNSLVLLSEPKKETCTRKEWVDYMEYLDFFKCHPITDDSILELATICYAHAYPSKLVLYGEVARIMALIRGAVETTYTIIDV